LSSAFVFSQNTNYSDLNLLIQKKKYAACLKKAEKKIQEFPEQPLPHFYKAIALFCDSQDAEKKQKEKEADFFVCLNELQEARKNWNLDTAMLVSPKIMKTIQTSAISYINKYYVAKKTAEADSMIARYLKIFDSKWPAFTNYTFLNFYNVVSVYAESINTDKEKIYLNIENYLNLYFSSLPKNRDIMQLKNEQLAFFTQYKKMNENGLDTLADRQILLVLQRYDNSKDAITNYIAFDVYEYFSMQIKKASGKKAEKYTIRMNKIIEKCPALFYKKEACRFEESYCFPDWDKPQYLIANTAKNAQYFTEDEKDIIYLMNMVRINPKLFKETFLKQYLKNGPSTEAERSLVKYLEKLQPVSLLYPSEKLFQSSEFHAKDMGNTGLDGHNSSDKTSFEKRLDRYMKSSVMGENCEYGSSDPIHVVMQLLIDDGIPDYGHRLNILSPEFVFVGTSKKPHKKFGWNTVMDFAGN
jgi:hypothetical protein